MTRGKGRVEGREVGKEGGACGSEVRGNGKVEGSGEDGKNM